MQHFAFKHHLNPFYPHDKTVMLNIAKAIKASAIIATIASRVLLLTLQPILLIDPLDLDLAHIFATGDIEHVL